MHCLIKIVFLIRFYNILPEVSLNILLDLFLDDCNFCYCKLIFFPKITFYNALLLIHGNVIDILLIVILLFMVIL